MPLTVPQLLMRLTLAPMVLAAVVGAVRLRALPPNLRALLWVVGFALPLNVLGLALLLLRQNNLFLMPVYAAGEFALLALVYYRTLSSARTRQLLPWLAGGFALYVLLDSLDLARLRTFRVGQQVLQSLLILLLVGLYFRQLLNELHVVALWREPLVWVSTGLALYHCGYLQIALFSNYLLHYSRQLNMEVWALHSVLFILLYSCYLLAFRLVPVRAVSAVAA